MKINMLPILIGRPYELLFATRILDRNDCNKLIRFHWARQASVSASRARVTCFPPISVGSSLETSGVTLTEGQPCTIYKFERRGSVKRLVGVHTPDSARRRENRKTLPMLSTRIESRFPPGQKHFSGNFYDVAPCAYPTSSAALAETR